MDYELSRRQFFRLGAGDVIRGLLRRKEEGEKSARPPIRPPGALPSEDEFLATCERCGKCAEACPFDVIALLSPASGKAEGTPRLLPDETPCRWCNTWDCIHACPSGALSITRGAQPAPIAKVELTLDLCLTTQGVLCDTCTHYCPPAARALTMHGREPRLDADRCTGCGLCIHHCEATPSAFRLEK